MSEKLIVPANPCSTCPYRKDVPSGVWAREEYDKLPQWDDPMNFAGTFLCHQADRKAICRGWAEVHGNNFNCRVAVSLAHNISEEPSRYPLYKSGAEARRAGIKALDKPSAKACAAISKIIAKRKP